VEGREPIDRRAWLVLGVASLAGFATALDLSVMFVAFPDIRDDFAGTSTALLSWVLTIYSIVVAALLIPSGRLADLFGRRRMFLLGVAVFGLGSLLAGLALGPLTLVSARAVQATGGAMLIPAAMANLLQEFPASRRAMAVGTFGAVGGLAAAAGPALGSLVVEAGGWRWALLMNVPLAVVVFTGGFFLFHESTRPETRLTDLPGSLLVALAVAGLAFGIVQGAEVGWGDPIVLAGFLVSFVAGALVVHRSRTHPEPVLDLRLFRDRTFTLANVVAVLFSMAFFAMFFGLVLFLDEAWGEPTGTAGLMVTPLLLTSSAMSFVGGRLADRLGHRRVMVPGSLLFAAGAVALGLWAGAEPNLALWLPSVVLLGFGVGAVYPSFQSAAVRHVPAERFGVASAVVHTNSRIAATIAVALSVVLVGGFEAGDPISDFDPFFFLLAGLGLLSALVSLGIDTRQGSAP
jgi:EmrB/QacA subfamily drug resistance transporter